VIEIGIFLLGVVVGVPITLIVEEILHRFKKGLASWRDSGPARTLTHPLILSRELDDRLMRVRVTNHGLVSYLDIQISTPIGNLTRDRLSSGELHPIRIGRLDPGESASFLPEDVGLSLEDFDDVIGSIPGDLTPMSDKTIMLRSFFINPSVMRRLFRRRIEWWCTFEPSAIARIKPMQSAVLATYLRSCHVAQRKPSTSVTAQIMALSDVDAREVLQAPNDDWNFQRLRLVLGRQDGK
jgi:hypothetical protein